MVSIEKVEKVERPPSIPVVSMSFCLAVMTSESSLRTVISPIRKPAITLRRGSRREFGDRGESGHPAGDHA